MPFEELFFGFLICLIVAYFCMKRTLLRFITAVALTAGSALDLATDMPSWQCLLCAAGIWLALAAVAFGFLWALCAVVDQNKEQEKDNKFYRTVMNIYIEALKVLVGVRFHITGAEKLPKDGRFLLVCNHLSLADPVLLLNAFPHAELAFITKQENQQMFIVGNMMHKIMCQPLNRENDRAALKTILKCIQLIKDDEVNIAAFPEGYCSMDGKLHPFRSGVFKIAQKTNVPIVVCTLTNTLAVFTNMKKLKKTDVDLHLVDVIPPEALKGRNTVEIGEQIYEMMIADLGEEYRYTEINT